MSREDTRFPVDLDEWIREACVLVMSDTSGTDDIHAHASYIATSARSLFFQYIDQVIKAYPAWLIDRTVLSDVEGLQRMNLDEVLQVWLYQMMYRKALRTLENHIRR